MGDLIKIQETRNMWRYINLSRNRKRLGFITSVEVNMNGT